MRSALKIVPILAAITALFNSCKNDLHILAPYKESVSVYGILNPQDTIQMIRINKIFLGEGNAYTMAQVNDSVNYKPGVLTVTLEREVNGVKVQTTKGSTKTQIVLRDTVIQLASTTNAIFNSNQRLYITSDRLYNSGTYKLNIKNNNTGNVFTAQTVMVDTIRQGLYQPFASPFFPVPYSPTNIQSYFIDYSTSITKSHTLRFLSVKDAKEYTCTMRFYYADSLVSNPFLQPHYVDYTIPSVKSTGLAGNEAITITFFPDAFLATVEGGINKIGTPSNFAGRHATHIDFIVTSGAQEFVDFLEVSAPSTSVSQDKPAYTNINGGFGIFSSKSVRVFPKAIWNSFLDYMSQNKPMCSLGFFNSASNLGFTCN